MHFDVLVEVHVQVPVTVVAESWGDAQGKATTEAASRVSSAGDIVHTDVLSIEDSTAEHS